jgi:hypothetical protein
MERSKFMSLNQRDLLRGLIVAFGTAATTQLVAVLQAGSVPTVMQLKFAALSGIAAGMTYLVKNMFTNSNGQMVKGEGK